MAYISRGFDKGGGGGACVGGRVTVKRRGRVHSVTERLQRRLPPGAGLRQLEFTARGVGSSEAIGVTEQLA